MCALWEMRAWLQRGQKSLTGCQQGGSSPPGRDPGAVCLATQWCQTLTPALCPARPSFMRIPQAGILESVAKLSSRGLPNQGLNLKVNVMSNSL